ncbi:Neutral/alkaline non-lysosomal ceramidase [Perilla frutescens var. hirtella]|nr:Neutral/alkaline non-lysosomal ceramidase [Perilla frutescens var. hirtella]
MDQQFLTYGSVWPFQGASTLYGPHTLSAYIQEFQKLATTLINGKPVESGPQPPDLLDNATVTIATIVKEEIAIFLYSSSLVQKRERVVVDGLDCPIYDGGG